MQCYLTQLILQFLLLLFIVLISVQDRLKTQNLLVVIVSYIFYYWWDWRFLAFLIFSTIVDYSMGIKIHK